MALFFQAGIEAEIAQLQEQHTAKLARLEAHSARFQHLVAALSDPSATAEVRGASAPVRVGFGHQLTARSGHAGPRNRKPGADAPQSIRDAQAGLEGLLNVNFVAYNDRVRVVPLSKLGSLGTQ